MAVLDCRNRYVVQYIQVGPPDVCEVGEVDFGPFDECEGQRWWVGMTASRMEGNR